MFASEELTNAQTEDLLIKIRNNDLVGVRLILDNHIVSVNKIKNFVSVVYLRLSIYIISYFHYFSSLVRSPFILLRMKVMRILLSIYIDLVQTLMHQMM